MKFHQLSQNWRKINQQWGLQTRSLLNALDLTHTDRMVLMTLNIEQQLSKKRLAEANNIRPQSLTRSIERLVSKGLLLKTPSPHDTRSVSFHLTASAQLKVQQLEAHNEKLWKKMLCGFDTAERQIMAKNLDRMRANLILENNNRGIS